MNKRDLKAYARFDGNLRVIPGSLVLRKSMPKNGNWKEVQGYECCNDITVTLTPEDLSISDIDLVLYCNGVELETYISNRTSTDMDSLLSILNTTWGMLGVFSSDDDITIKWVMSIDQKKALCPQGPLTFNLISD